VPSNEGLGDSLGEALARHGIELPDEQIVELQRYCHLLWEWNEKLNLTRHTDYDKFVSRDVVDSQQFEQFLDAGERVLDMGTGGGVPGIILAILRPDLSVELSDSVAKKARAVADIVKRLEMSAPVHHARAEAVLAQQQFTTVVARAVAPLGKMLRWVAPYWDNFDRLLVIKGPAWVEERKAARESGLMKHLDLRKLSAYPLPETNSESVVLSITPKDK
jgi:16S rRNA (guanine527-N7)-methyltransferase